MAIIEFYQEFINFFPSYVGTSLNLLIMILVVVLYAVFVWKFHTLISVKNILGLDLNKYNHSEATRRTKLITGFWFFLEYIIILPFIIFIVYLVFTFFLIIISQDQEISNLLIVSALIIAVIRVTAYYKENLSEEIAKILPVTLLVVAMLDPAMFTKTQFFEKIITQFGLLPEFFGEIIYYLLFIIVLEVILRFFDFIFSLFGLEEEN